MPADFTIKEEAAFGNWLAGFIDGEGCFMVRKHTRNPTHHCSFRLALHRDDRAILHEIQGRTGLGHVCEYSTDGRAAVAWQVTSRSHCLGLVALLDQYPLRARKARDYATWRKAVMAWTRIRPGANHVSGPNDWSEMANLRERLMRERRH